MNGPFMRAAIVLVLCWAANGATLFVSSFNNNSIIKFDYTTGASLGVFVPSGSGGLSKPQHLAFGPDGNLYVASCGTNSIPRYNGVTGAFIDAFVPSGSGGLNCPGGLGFGKDGNLYVTHQHILGQVLKYDGRSGAFLGVFATPGALAVDLVVAVSGNLYVLDAITHSVYLVDSSSGISTTFVPGSVMGSVAGIATDTKGDVAVSLSVSAFLPGFVIIYNPAGMPIGGTSPGMPGSPGTGVVAFGPDDNLTAAAGNSVVEFTPTGATVRTFTDPNVSGIAGITFDVIPVVAVPITDAVQTRYASNLNIGDSAINITNTGASATAAAGGGFSGGNLCVNAYVFDQEEELLACCSCFVTPDGLQSISVKNSLIGNTLTPAAPSSVVIKLISTAGPDAVAGPTGGVNGCDASAVTFGTLARGMRAWGTTLHAKPTTPVTYGVTETPFSNLDLSQAELNHLTSFCAFIKANASGFGVCRGCTTGGLGAAVLR